MSKYATLVSEFMKGRISVYDVCQQLGRLDAILIRLNPVSPVGYDSDGGPYILIWRADDENPMVWGSRDSFLIGLGYRCGNDSDDEIRLASSLRENCRNFEAVTFSIEDHSNLLEDMQNNLSLDSDLSRGNNTDSEISHSVLRDVFNSRDSFIIAQAVAAQPVVTTQYQTGENEMSNKILAIVARGKSSVATAAQIQAGKALNITVMRALKAQAPFVVRGYLDHPVAPALVAVLLVAGSEFVPAGPAREKVAKAADLMLIAALTDGADKFLDVEGLIDKAFAGLPDEAKALL